MPIKTEHPKPVSFDGFLRKITSRIKVLIPVSFRAAPFLAAVCTFLFCLAVLLANLNAGNAGDDPDEFAAGKVAERDVIAESAITYEDTEATQQRQEIQERLVPAVFHYDFKTSDDMKASWNKFISSVTLLSKDTPENFIQRIQTEFPGFFAAAVLTLLYDNSGQTDLLQQAGLVFTGIVDTGIFSIPRNGSLENLNSDAVELIRSSGSRVERERISYGTVITRETIPLAVEHRIISGSSDPEHFHLLLDMVEPFLTENVFFSAEETVQRLIETRNKTEPVIKYIERGKRVIKKGFIITEEDMIELRALNMSQGSDIRIIFSRVLLLLLIFCFMVFFCGKRIIHRNLSDPEVYLICVLSALYIAGSVLARNATLGFTSFPVSLVIPTALVVILPAILIHPRLALLLALTLPLGSYFSEIYDSPSLIFALVSGASASFVLQKAEKRMDLLKAGLIIAAANIIAIIAVMLGQRVGAASYPGMIFWAAFNGIASGMLVLGFLPPLEQALGAATTFRLIELSDLNAPILRRLFTAAPGTYSHSVLVANLAESACQDIGANSLLARVGAYYHDIGKMDNPNYFAENQTDLNPHDDLAPRHSVTILRNHVKLGVEKARQLKLPGEVIEIIANHHGNSVMTWFYSKALKQEGKDAKKNPVNPEDYQYQGSPPRSRESAVVMLADTTEAAVRTLDKPTPAKMEKYIEELIADKAGHGQLARSELTFKDMETIRQAFLRVLMSYHHSRIAYPKVEIPKIAEQESAAPEAETTQ